MRGGRKLRLQRRKFMLLECLARNAGQVVTRGMSLDASWTYDIEPRANLVDTPINRLLNKVDKGFAVALIHAVVSAGYMLKYRHVEPPA
ncbi:transcriptional regulator [Paraburkholderia sp. BL18I3N2]|uniref:winged helix-turn-helix domain-containing protein n=1 Tax=Paraburkholderia sp. BL18I3N2 TaxID=1938799 RepID=UPI000D4E2AE3|nr:winged helix-turn-helix domain-containing protein [Paraburkholderia sp. BL18I3N2]PRX22317.1 transcriptional regulator [Paraburkholderia sp. BL18I3N2]